MIDQQRFEELAGAVQAALPAGFGFTLDASGEHSDFVRFNHAAVRQAGSVSQGAASLRLVQGSRHAARAVTLSGDAAVDRGRLLDAADALAQLVPQLPEDPHLMLATEVNSTTVANPVDVPGPDEVVDTVTQAGQGTDLVGIYAGGTLWRGFANHHGQRNWFASGGTLLDYSLVATQDKAVKASVGGKDWSPDAVRASIEGSRAQLGPLARPSRAVKPGSYRAYLSPAAVVELTDMWEWGGFSIRGQRTKVSPLQKLVDGERELSPLVSVSEDTAGGIGPNFQGEGFVKPASVPLISEGRHAGAMISPRSAAEYGLRPNGASKWERPSSLSMAGGGLDEAQILERLGTGVYVSNLWYLNFSDRNACRVTGMTRFATFWVEDGQLVAPLDVMRFDVSLYDLFGSGLEALTSEVAFLPSSQTYGGRSTDSKRVPGALVSGLTFTL